MRALAALRGAPLAKIFHLALEHADALAHAAAVDFELGFPRTAQADAAADARQVRPHVGQTRQQIFQLRQLHLQLPLRGMRALGENIQDQPGAIEHLHVQHLFQVALLRGRQLPIEDDQRGLGRFHHRFQLLRFALAQVGARIGLLAPLRDDLHHLAAGGVRQLFQLGERLFPLQLGIFQRGQHHALVHRAP